MSNLTVKDRLPALQAAIKALTAERVLVGIPSEKGLRKPEDGERGAMNNAAIGYLMETGVPELNIPERAWLVPGVKIAMPTIEKRMRACAMNYLAGRPEDVKRVLGQVGLIAQNEVRMKINTGPFAPLSPVTITMRRKRGRTGTRPLIDTGQMRNAVTYVLRPANAMAGP